MESDLSLEFLRVTEQAAVACAHTMGQGDRHKSDQVAVEAMRHEMDSVPIDGTIVIGEGERDEAPMLFIGEKVGLAQKDNSNRRKWDEVDIAVEVGGRDIPRIVATYADAPSGELCALFGSTDHLEVAINAGDAAATLRLSRGAAATVRVVS